jgi:transcriptional regulator with XRE-family HTH domain
MDQPTRCLAEKTNSYTVQFNGIGINLSRVSDETGLAVGYLSKIFSGGRNGSVRTVRLIADALGMSLESFVSSLPGGDRL